MPLSDENRDLIERTAPIINRALTPEGTSERALEAILNACRLEERAKAEGEVEKRAPVQGFTPGIPWSMHLRAYDAYREKWGEQKALIDLEGRNCRGGFGTKELDMFIPGWRDELSELTTLKSNLAKAEARIAELTQEGEATERRLRLQMLEISEHAGAHLCRAETAEAALSRATQAEELVREVVGVLEDVAELHTRFREKTTGNQADAYYTFVKGQTATWGSVHALLAKLKAAPLQGDA